MSDNMDDCESCEELCEEIADYKRHIRALTEMRIKDCERAETAEIALNLERENNAAIVQRVEIAWKKMKKDLAWLFCEMPPRPICASYASVEVHKKNNLWDARVAVEKSWDGIQVAIGGEVNQIVGDRFALCERIKAKRCFAALPQDAAEKPAQERKEK